MPIISIRFIAVVLLGITVAILLCNFRYFCDSVVSIVQKLKQHTTRSCWPRHHKARKCSTTCSCYYLTVYLRLLKWLLPLRHLQKVHTQRKNTGRTFFKRNVHVFDQCGTDSHILCSVWWAVSANWLEKTVQLRLLYFINGVSNDFYDV